jgi:hypothetical protein
VLEVAAAPGQAWTVQIDGPLTSACLYFSACFQVTEEYSNTPISSGVGPQRVAVNWYGSQGPNLDPGNYGASISFVPQGGDPAFAVQVNLEVVSASALPATSEAKATALWERGCVPTDPVLSYTFAVRCDIPDEAPVADPAITLPAVGQVFIDPTFGGKITRVTGPGCETEYGTTTAFSKQNTYLLTSCGVFRIADNSLVRAPRDNIGFTSMSATDDEVYYHLLGTEIRRYNFVTDQETILGDFGPLGFQILNAGGTAPTSSDDWLAFFDYSALGFPKICAVDLLALQAAGVPGPDNTYCASYQGTQYLTQLDWVSVSDIDDPTGKRFVYLSASPLSIVFTVGQNGSGQLQQEYIVPEMPGQSRNNDDGICVQGEICYNADNFTHDAIFKDRDGQIKLFGNFQDILLDRDYNSTFRLNAGLKILRPEVEGGGQNILGRANWDKQPGCSSIIQACTAAYVETGHRYAARVMQASPSGNNTLLTLSASTGWDLNSIHAVRVQNGTNSWGCLNGAWTATSVSDAVVQIPAVCTGATGALDRVILGDASQPFTGAQNDNRGQIQIWRPGRQVHRIAMHRSVVWNDVPGTGISSYGSTPRASISRDGRYVAFNSNWGALDFDGESVYIIQTGLGAPENQITVKSLTPGTNAAVLNYDIPNGQACAIEVSADPTFQNPVESFTDAAGTVTRSTPLGHGTLAAGTSYWMRMQCGLEVESKDFRTMDPVAASLSTLTTNVGASDDSSVVAVLIEYRAVGDPSFTSTPVQECATGCEVSWTGTAGTVSEYRVDYLDVNSVVVRKSDTFLVAVLP